MIDEFCLNGVARIALGTFTIVSSLITRSLYYAYFLGGGDTFDDEETVGVAKCSCI